MAKIVKEMPGGTTTLRYPWNELLDGKIRLLKRGDDFSTQESSFRTCAYMAAANRKVKVSIRIRDEGVYIQAIK